LAYQQGLALIEHRNVFFHHVNNGNKIGKLQPPSKPSKIKPIIILHGAVFITHTIVFSDQGNAFLPLRSGFMLKTRKRANLEKLRFVKKCRNNGQ
jgi:hypothetical protein